MNYELIYFGASLLLAFGLSLMTILLLGATIEINTISILFTSTILAVSLTMMIKGVLA